MSSGCLLELDSLEEGNAVVILITNIVQRFLDYPASAGLLFLPCSLECGGLVSFWLFAASLKLWKLQ